MFEGAETKTTVLKSNVKETEQGAKNTHIGHSNVWMSEWKW